MRNIDLLEYSIGSMSSHRFLSIPASSSHKSGHSLFRGDGGARVSDSRARSGRQIGGMRKHRHGHKPDGMGTALVVEGAA